MAAVDAAGPRFVQNGRGVGPFLGVSAEGFLPEASALGGQESPPTRKKNQLSVIIQFSHSPTLSACTEHCHLKASVRPLAMHELVARTLRVSVPYSQSHSIISNVGLPSRVDRAQGGREQFCVVKASANRVEPRSPS